MIEELGSIRDMYHDLLSDGWAGTVLTPEAIGDLDVEQAIAEVRRDLKQKARDDRIRIQTVVNDKWFDPRVVVVVRRFRWIPTPRVQELIWRYTGYHACLSDPFVDEATDPLCKPFPEWIYCPMCAHEFDRGSD